VTDSKTDSPVDLSVVILNYNGRAWVPRCLRSLGEQTAADKMEVIVADNSSTDGSDKMAAEILTQLAIRGRVVRNGGNLGYCAGNNEGARTATGEYLLFLNTDTWLEPDCIEKLLASAQTANVDSASPLVLDYDDDRFQGNGASGFDVFGYLTNRKTPLPAGRIFGAPGCALMVKRNVFETVGEFDSEFFMYADEADLAWRLTLSGARTITVPDARVHHRGAAAANPKGGGQVLEFRTNEMVRFFATRNSLLVVLKNAQHLLLFLCLTQLAIVALEMLFVMVTTRRWSVVRKAYLSALLDVWRLRHHVKKERQRVKKLRRCGDLTMLRFLKLRPGRWVDIEKLLRLGPPRVGTSRV
jgi:N-acetylglucosaminyl-diphospho-decaprenol L-rhamnosyltransferase